MAGHVYRLRDLGQTGAREILRRAAALRGTRALTGKTALLCGLRPDLCDHYARAVRGAGGEVRIVPPEENPAQNTRSQPAALHPEADFVIAQARSRAELESLGEAFAVPLFNALDDADAPLSTAAALLPLLDAAQTGLRVTWMGENASEANTWIEAALYFSFELFLFIPPDAAAGRMPDPNRLDLALQAGAKIFLTDDPRLALDGAQYVAIGDQIMRAATQEASQTQMLPQRNPEEQEEALAAVLAAVLERFAPPPGAQS